MQSEATPYHHHVNEDGLLVRCYHKCKRGAVNILAAWQFWLGMTISFPFEHYLYEKVWPFTLVTKFLGL